MTEHQYKEQWPTRPLTKEDQEREINSTRIKELASSEFSDADIHETLKVLNLTEQKDARSTT